MFFLSGRFKCFQSHEEKTKSDHISLVRSKLTGFLSEWQLKVFQLIQKIPPGVLISYGELARWANRRFGLKVNARNTAWLRNEIYQIVGNETEIPIHRNANEGDAETTKDSKNVQMVNKRKRLAAGSYPTPRWFRPK